MNDVQGDVLRVSVKRLIPEIQEPGSIVEVVAQADILEGFVRTVMAVGV